MYNDGALESVLGFGTRAESAPSNSKEGPNRVPPVPPLVYCAISLWCGSAATYVLLENAGIETLETLLVALVAGAVLACAVFVATKSPVASIVLFLLLGCVFGANGALSFHSRCVQLPDNGEYEIVLRDDPRASSRGSYASVSCCLQNGQTIDARAFFKETTDLLNNARISARCAFSAPSEEYAHSNYMSDLQAQANIESFETSDMPVLEGAIYDIRRRAIDLLSEHGGKQASLLQALLCGYRPTLVDEGYYEDYKKCGIAHIVAVSGAHLAIVTMALGLLLKALRVPRLPYVGISLFFVFAYLLFAGMPISAMRAALMCALFLVSGLMRRRNATLNSLGVCVVLFIVLDPSAAVSISLFLSAASTFGIVMFANMFSEWAAAFPKVLKDAFAAPLAMTAASNVATLPFSVSVFGMLPVVAPLANILVTPIFTCACVLGVAALMASLTIPQAAGVLIGIASVCALPMNAISGFLASVPNACLEVQAGTIPMLLMSGAIVAGLCLFRPRISARHVVLPLVALLVFLAVSAIRLPVPPSDRIVMLDVGQGDAFMIESEGASLLIDTGNEAERLRKSLNYAQIYDIEAVSISHSDSDHCEAIGNIRDLYKDARFLCARQMLECECRKCSHLEREALSLFDESSVTGIGVGDSFDIGNFNVRVLWPEAYKDSGGNGDSLCLLASLDVNKDGEVDWRALFTGDAESDELAKMVSTGAIGDIDVLKVGHHGSKVSVSDHVLDILRPEYALISAGEGNSYGHPSKEALHALEMCGAQIFRTDEQGCVELRFSENGISVATER